MVIQSGNKVFFIGLSFILSVFMATIGYAKESTVEMHRDQLTSMLATKPIIVSLANGELNQITQKMMTFSDQLPTQFFTGRKLKSEVREKSIKIAKERFSEIGLPNLKILDMLYVGSLASYEYDDLSDVDIHIIIDPASYGNDRSILKHLLSKTNDLNEFLYDRITYYGRKVDFSFYLDTVEVRLEPGVGIYSLTSDSWLSQPKPAPMKFSPAKVVSDVRQYVDRYNALAVGYEKNKLKFNCEEFSKLREEIRSYRHEGISRDGIRSTENIVYRSLRRIGGNLFRQTEDLGLECKNIQASIK